jgi:hypothetical protein
MMKNLHTFSSMRARTVLVALAVAGAMFVAACDEKLSDLTGPTPNLEPTFSSIQREIFQTTDSAGRRACTECHNARTSAFTAGLNLEANVAYASLVSVRSTEKPALFRVAPGDPDNSYLVHKLDGGPDIVGLRMPRGNGPFLTQGQMTVIRRWIALGAPNN